MTDKKFQQITGIITLMNASLATLSSPHLFVAKWLKAPNAQ
ncbi:MAG: hypothetical protein ACFN20_01080 [Bacteroidota bacterium]